LVRFGGAGTLDLLVGRANRIIADVADNYVNVGRTRQDRSEAPLEVCGV